MVCMRWGRTLCLLGVLGLVSSPGLGSEPTDGGPSATSALGLEELTLWALEHNPALAAVEELRQEVQGGVVEARADAFPQLEAVAAWDRSRNPSFLNSPDFQDFVPPGFEPSEQEVYNLGMELTQTLYSGGKIAAALELASVLVDLAETSIDSARLDLAADVATTYYQFLGAQRAIETIELQERARRQNLETVENRLELGEATRLEQLQAVAALAQVRPQLEQRRGDALVLEAELKALLGIERDREVAVRPVDRLLPPGPGFDTLLAWADGQRPELLDLDLQIQSLELQQTIRRADGRPQLEFTGRYGHQARLAEDLTDSLFADWGVGFGLRWSFFDGGRRRGEIARLASQSRQLALQIEDLRRRIEVQIEEGLSSYTAARAGWEASKVAAEAAREARRVAAESYHEGIALQVDLLNAQDQEASSELLEVEAYYRALQAVARLARAVGMMPSELIERADEGTPHTPTTTTEESIATETSERVIR